MANEKHLAKQNEIVVFVGHAEDADDAVRAVLDTEAELQKRLRRYCEAAKIDPLVFRYWEWRRDAESLPGGQASTITPELDAAQAAVFIFRDRVGKVTWSELDHVRRRGIPIVAVFPKTPAGDMSNPEIVRPWLDLLNRKKNLTASWTHPDGMAIAPAADYENDDDIRNVALDKLDRILATLVANRNSPRAMPVAVDIREYLEGVLSETDHIRISGIGTEAGNVRSAGRYPIERLYTPLKSRGGGRELEDMREVALSELLPRNPRLLIEGQPGAGKSTFLKFVATMLARDGLGTPCPDAASWSERYLGTATKDTPPVPVWLRFSELVPLMEKEAGSGRQGHNPVDESSTMSIARIRHVAIPQFAEREPAFIAWCKRPGCPVDTEPLRWEQPGGLASMGA